MAQDDSYWRAVARAADRAAATRTLDDAHSELLQRQLVILKWRTEKLRQDPEAANRLRTQEAPVVARGDVDVNGDELRAREVSRGFADDEEQMLASSEVETKDVRARKAATPQPHKDGLRVEQVQSSALYP